MKHVFFSSSNARSDEQMVGFVADRICRENGNNFFKRSIFYKRLIDVDNQVTIDEIRLYRINVCMFRNKQASIESI